MKTYLDKFFKFLEVEMNASTHTIINYKNDLKQAIDFFQKENCTDIFSITHQIIRKFLAYLKEKEYKKTSIVRKLAALKSFFNFLLREEYLKTNPAKYVITPKQEKKLPNFLDIDEIFSLLDQPQENKILEIRNKAILETLYSTGIRVSELVFLNLNDIDFIGGLVKISGKGKKQRICPIGEKAVNSINEYLLKRNELSKKNLQEKALFLNKNGKRLTDRSIRNIINQYLKQAKIHKKVSPHTFRHSFATHLLNAGCDLRTVQELLGHTNLTSTQIYTHITTTYLKSVYDKTHPRA